MRESFNAILRLEICPANGRPLCRCFLAKLDTRLEISQTKTTRRTYHSYGPDLHTLLVEMNMPIETCVAGLIEAANGRMFWAIANSIDLLQLFDDWLDLII